jgi:hypothetical protein
MSVVAEAVTVEQIHELIIAGEPSRAKEIWLNQIKPTLDGHGMQFYRWQCITMRVEHVINCLSRSKDPRDNAVAARITTSLLLFRRS